MFEGELKPSSSVSLWGSESYAPDNLKTILYTSVEEPTTFNVVDRNKNQIIPIKEVSSPDS